jgi:predicted heme/steroid binding protein
MKQLLFTSFVLLPNTSAFTQTITPTPPKTSHRKHITTRPSTHLALELNPPILLAAAGTFAAATYWLSQSENRQKQQQYAQYEAVQSEKARLAKIEPRDSWTVEELKQYNGEQDETGPILIAVKGDVFNVWKGRNFYGKDGEYHIMAGKDATRFLAKNRLEEESDENLGVELNIAERANLEVGSGVL